MNKLLNGIKLNKLKHVNDFDQYLKTFADIYTQLNWASISRSDLEKVNDLLNGLDHFKWFKDFLKCCITLDSSNLVGNTNAFKQFFHHGLANLESINVLIRPQIKCNTCGRLGHISSKCFQNTKKAPSQHQSKPKVMIAKPNSSVRKKNLVSSTNVVSRAQEKKKMNQQNNLLIKLFLNLSSETNAALVTSEVGLKTSTWIIDSGAAHDRSLFDQNSLKAVKN